ncbi:MAG: phosphatase PAP2 family protein [Actinobacteria bacterium]|nr:phosphatase PAP2 family protein [Actinomycetota bacterium]
MGKQEKRYFITATLCALAFIIVCVSIASGALWVQVFDDAVTNVVYSWHTAQITPIVSVFTHIGGVAASVSIAVVVAIVLYASKQWGDLKYFLATFLSGQAVLWGIKYACSRVRPTANLITLPSDPSFPSGHSFTNSILCAFIVLFLCDYFSRTYSRTFKSVVIPVALLLVVGIGLSRVYLGVHWPSDVLGAWLLASCVFCAGSGIHAMRRRRTEGVQATVCEGA